MSCCDRDPETPRGVRAYSRRDLFSLAARGAGAALVAPSMLDLLFRHAAAQAVDQGRAQKRLVVLWMEGGPSQIDTFDPKPGAATNGPFQAIPTGQSGWLMGEHLPELAKRAERLAVVRTLTSKEGNHARARELLHCGYTPNPSVAFPPLCAIAAHEFGDLDADLPAFVQIGGTAGSGGYLGTKSAPFVVTDPTKRVENLTYAKGMTRDHLDEREAMCDLLDAEFARQGAERAVEENLAQRRRARRLMDSKLRTAFDLNIEKKTSLSAYGRSKFGGGCLLARRLLEAGVTAVEVVLENWDTHVDNFNKTRELCKQLDPAFSALLDDLRTRDLLQDTLVVCMGEFGRTPSINPSDGRDHWPNNSCVVLAGGGIKPGLVLGATDERGENIVQRPVQVADLFATLAQALGIERDKEFLATTRRPVKLVDPNGVVVPELLA